MKKISDERQYAPATQRNRDFILDVLRDVLPTTGVILEIASGSGEHIFHFARHLPALVFQPSNPDRDALSSIGAWVKATGVTNVRAPIALGASHSVWPIASADGIICINMVHISPWEATLGLITGAADTRSRLAALSLWSLHTRRVRHSPEQPSIRPEPSRPQPERQARRWARAGWRGQPTLASASTERALGSCSIIQRFGRSAEPVALDKSGSNTFVLHLRRAVDIGRDAS